MSIKDVMAYLKSLDSAPAEAPVTPVTPGKTLGLQEKPIQIKAVAPVTPVTPEKFMGLQEKPIQINAVTPVTPVTSKNTDSRENFPACPVISMLATAQNPPGSDRWCWPHTTAMNTAEIESFTQRASVFNRRGMAAVEAEELAYRLVNRDREEDDRKLCMECAHLEGSQPGSWSRGAWRCSQWQRAGMGAAGVPAGLVLVLQRCDGFKPMR